MLSQTIGKTVLNLGKVGLLILLSTGITTTIKSATTECAEGIGQTVRIIKRKIKTGGTEDSDYE